MDSSCEFQRSKKLNRWIRKSLPIITPWFLVPMGFQVFAAFLQGCAENSLEDVLLFVVLPVAGWIIFAQYCGTLFFGPTTTPSLVAAVITTMAGTYFLHISSAMSQFYNGSFGVLCVLLGFMFRRMVKSNPGRLTSGITIGSIPHHEDRSYDHKLPLDVLPAVHYGDSVRILGKPLRLKHCRHCNVQIERYDHHCPAIYNCVGRKNHALFLLMMVNFITVEALYLSASKVYLAQQTETWTWTKAVDEIMRRKPWVFGTTLFALLHVLWQVPFIGFHFYCACINLTTDEMFHWESYTDFHVETPPEPGRPYGGKEFCNPYSNGIKNNLSSFFRS